MSVGVGGFNARIRTVKSKDKAEDDLGDLVNEEASSSASIMSSGDEKPRKKNRCRKPKSKYAESYPSYIQVFIVWRIYDEDSFVADRIFGYTFVRFSFFFFFPSKIGRLFRT